MMFYDDFSNKTVSETFPKFANKGKPSKNRLVLLLADHFDANDRLIWLKTFQFGTINRFKLFSWSVHFTVDRFLYPWLIKRL